jgi:hypothetical protein
MAAPSRISPAVKDRTDRTMWVLDRLKRNERYLRQSPLYPAFNPRQLAFLALECEEAMYGGAAGGGKSSALLMAALMFADTPGYNALILRRSFQDLSQPGAIMDRAREWLSGTDARWNATNKRWTFPSGASLTFGYLKNAGSHLQYQGAEYSFIAFDELTQFEGYQYRYLFSRLRRLQGSGIPMRMRAASNPGGPGHDWVKRRFIDKRRPDRAFIPAKFSDNPYLDQAEYLKALSKLDAVTRAQLMKGDWYISKAGLIYPEFGDCAVQASEVPWGRLRKVQDWHGGIDWGWNNPFAAVHGALDDDDVLWVSWCRYKRFCTISDHAARLPRDERFWDAYEPLCPPPDDGEDRESPAPKSTLWFADPSRPENIVDLARADFAVHPAPNRIDAGIDVVRERLATGRLKVLATLAPIFTEAGMYRDSNDTSRVDDEDDDDSDDKVGIVQYGGAINDQDDSYDVVADTAAEEPEAKFDHCFPGGTLVETDRGHIPIQYVKAGDRVRTRRGYHPVKAAGRTRLDAPLWAAELSDGQRVVATPNHPIWTRNRGWIRLDALRYGDIMDVRPLTTNAEASCERSASHTERSISSSSWASSIDDTRTPNAGPTGPITGRPGASGSTRRSGSTITARSPRGITSTTRTRTRSTTIRATWSAFLATIISWAMRKRGPTSGGDDSERSPTRSATYPPSGIEPRKGEPGTANTPSGSGGIVNPSNGFATTARSRSCPSPCGPMIGSARTTANRLGGVLPAWMTRLACAMGVRGSFESTATRSPSSAPVFVIGVTDTGRREPVYDLTVDGPPEFYADGVLVHNCMDALRYLCAGIAKVHGNTWADKLDGSSGEDRPEMGSFGVDGFEGEEPEDYTRSPGRRKAPQATPGKQGPRYAEEDVDIEAKRRWRSVHNDQMWST